MTTEYDWPTVCALAIQSFNGQTPGAQLEQTIIDHFQHDPARVVTHIQDLGRRIAKGENIRSGWAILELELQHKPANVTATDDQERAKQTAIAERWIRNAGGYLDREDELVSELFDPEMGRLRHWPNLKPQMVDLWQQQRPRFQTTEAEALERQTRYRKPARIREAPADWTPTDPELAYIDTITNDPDQPEQ